ncbi:hypothetical protein RUM43_014707 [Polyplax serrata]|uniref:Uncharacterized protein n=1 Tax=Polyplax serrata TaxID=468196 RepID=A0AAN8PSP9_POLSC
MEREVESPRQSYFKHHISDEERDKDAVQMKLTSKLTADKTCSCGKSTSDVFAVMWTEKEREVPGGTRHNFPSPQKMSQEKLREKGQGHAERPEIAHFPSYMPDQLI